MNVRVARRGALCAILSFVVACSASSDKPFRQDDYAKSVASYMAGAADNFQGWSTDHMLVGASDCQTENGGQAGAMTECKVDTYDTEAAAMSSYITQRDRLTKALSGARGGEQKNAAPNTPLRFVAVSGRGSVMLVLTRAGNEWIVGYAFQKAPG